MRRLAALLACVACTGDPSAPHLARGNVLVNNGKREEAAAEYREAARLAPKSSLPLERLGDVLYDLRRKDEALAAYREAAARDAGAFTARIGAARVLTELGKLDDARGELTLAMQRQPTNLYLLLSRGNLYQRSGDSKAALRDYETAVHLESRNVPALFQYGGALLDDGQVDGAMAVARPRRWPRRTSAWRRPRAAGSPSRASRVRRSIGPRPMPYGGRASRWRRNPPSLRSPEIPFSAGPLDSRCGRRGTLLAPARGQW